MSILDVVNEQGETIGQATREEIHRDGLLHKEVHVWFYTPQDEIIFQHRSKTKDTFPDKLDATVGGHVEQGQSYVDAALREAKEEVGVVIGPSELAHIATTINTNFDPVTKTTNHPRREVFAYAFKGNAEDLYIEKGESLGFEAWPVEKLLALSQEEKERFIPDYVDERGLEIYKKIRAAYGKNS